MSLRQPDVQQIGDDFLFSYGVMGIRLEVAGVVSSRREGVHALVTVHSNAGRLQWTRLKMDSVRERKSLADELAKTIPLSDFPWIEALAQCALLTYEMSRAGEPTVLLTDVPVTLEAPYLLAPLLPLDESTTIYGDGDAGKSMMALLIALSVATGKPISGLRPPKKTGPVIYLDWETNAEAHARRLRRLVDGMGIGDQKIPVYYRRIVRPVAEEVRSLQHEIAKLGAVMVIVDSLGAAAGVTFGDSINDPSVGAGVMNTLRGLGVTRLAIHHMTHDAVKNGGSTAPTGSRYFRNYSRAVWELSREPVSPDVAHIALYNRKMNDDGKPQAPLSYEITYQPAGPIWFEACALSADLISRQSLSDQLVHHLASGPKQIIDLQHDTGKDPGAIRRALRGSSRFVELSSGGQGVTGGGFWAIQERHLTEPGDR